MILVDPRTGSVDYAPRFVSRAQARHYYTARNDPRLATVDTDHASLPDHVAPRAKVPPTPADRQTEATAWTPTRPYEP